MRLELSRFVKTDLDAIGDYIARDNPVRAVSFIDELIAEMQGLARNPLGSQVHKEIGPAARLLPYGRYVILFRVLDDVVRIERVVHGARRLRLLYSVSAQGS